MLAVTALRDKQKGTEAKRNDVQQSPSSRLVSRYIASATEEGLQRRDELRTSTTGCDLLYLLCMGALLLRLSSEKPNIFSRDKPEVLPMSRSSSKRHLTRALDRANVILRGWGFR